MLYFWTDLGPFDFSIILPIIVTPFVQFFSIFYLFYINFCQQKLVRLSESVTL